MLELFFGEVEGCGGKNAVDLLGAAAADDRGGDGGVVEGPGDGDDAGFDVVTLADGAEQVDEFKVAGDEGFLELFGVATEIVLRHFGDAVFGHGAGEKAGLHGRIVDDADVVAGAEREDFGLDGAIDHGVGRLQRGDGSDLEGALHLRDAEVGDANEAHFAFALEFGHGGPAFLDFFVGDGPMDLVEVDDVDLKAAEAGFDFFANFFEGLDNFAVGAPGHSALREEERLGGDGFQGGANDFFGVAEAVDGGGVDPVDACVKCAVDGLDGFAIFLWAPGVLPIASADGPGAEADSGEVKVGLAELPGGAKGVRSLCRRCIAHVALDAEWPGWWFIGSTWRVT